MTSSIANTLQRDSEIRPLASSTNPNLRRFANSALRASARFWFLVAVAGQWMFVYYITVFYGDPALRGDIATWTEHADGQYVPGEPLGNLAFAAHVFLAIAIIGGGPLQLIPQVRARAPRFHRWSGRVYMLAVVATSIAGLFMVWTRGSVGNLVMDMGITLDGILILVFAALAFHRAVTRNFASHRRWALRLFMVVSAVWFFRIGFMLWLLIHQAPVGFDPETFTGPFVYFLVFAQYLLPLAFLEMYLRARDGAGPALRLGVASGIFVATIATAAGVFAATMGMWLPRL